MLPGADHKAARDQRSHYRYYCEPDEHLTAHRPYHPCVSYPFFREKSVVHNFHGLLLLRTRLPWGREQSSSFFSQSGLPGLTLPVRHLLTRHGVSFMGREVFLRLCQCNLALRARGLRLTSSWLG